MAEEVKNMLDPEQYIANNPFMRANGMKIVSASPEVSEIVMDVHYDVTNIMGQVHGGVLYALADCVTGITARADGRKYVTQSAHVNFIGNVSEGTLHAKGVLVRRGRKIVIIRGIVTNEEGKLLLETTVDMFCLEK